MCLRSEAFAVDNGGPGVVVLLLRDPHLLKGAQGRQDGAPDPHRVLALRRGHDAHAHPGRRECRHLPLHPIGEAREHGGSARQHDVGEEVAAHVHVTLHDGFERGLVDAGGLEPDERRLEQYLRAAEALVADGYHLHSKKREKRDTERKCGRGIGAASIDYARGLDRTWPSGIA